MSKETETSLDMTKESDRELMLKYENDLLGGMLAAAGFRSEEICTINIVRKGVRFFSFRIHPLTEEEYMACMKRHTKYGRNRRLGTREQTDFDRAAYRCDLIYTATVPEDQKAVWGDHDGLWRKLDVLSGPQAIEKILKAGEKDRICDQIDEISGYTNEDAEAEIETAKN